MEQNDDRAKMSCDGYSCSEINANLLDHAARLRSENSPLLLACMLHDLTASRLSVFHETILSWRELVGRSGEQEHPEQYPYVLLT